MPLPKLGEFLGANEVAAAAFDEKLFADALTTGLAQKVAPALQPVLEAIVDRVAEKLPGAAQAAISPFTSEVTELRADVRRLAEQLTAEMAKFALPLAFTLEQKPKT